MPTYEYRCLDCDETFEHIEHIEEHGERLPECPNCGSHRIEQLMTPFFAKTSKKS